MKTIFYGRQFIDSYDIRLVSKALKEDLITTGRYVRKFENKISKFDDKIRNIALSHGIKKTSLEEDVKLARKAFKENKLSKIKMHLIDFRQALFNIKDEIDSL